jgi:hypothetical protein
VYLALGDVFYEAGSRCIRIPSAVQLDYAALHLAGHAPYEKEQERFCLRASTTQPLSCSFSHCSLPTWRLFLKIDMEISCIQKTIAL